MAAISDTIEVSQTRHTLELLKQYASKRIGRTTAESMEVHKMMEMGLEDMMLTLTASVLASRIAEDKYKAHFYWKEPSGWFQHWKKDKAPHWFTKRYPVQYDDKKATRTVKFTRFETYPQANIAIPKDQRTVEILGIERPLFDRIEEF